MARIDPTIVIEGLGFFARIFGGRKRKRLQKAMDSVQRFMTIREGMRRLEPRIVEAAAADRPLTLEPQEVKDLAETIEAARRMADELS